MNTSVLQDLGFTENESIVYLALIELGSCSATEIIKKSGLHRAVVYDLLERLNEKGLCSEIISGRKKFFEASDPRKLTEMIKEKEEKLNMTLPQLLELSKFKSKLDVKLYKGKEGIKTVFEDIIRNSPAEWLSLGSSGETYMLLPAFLDDFHKKRIKLGIKARGILLNNKISKQRGIELSRMKLTQIKYLPENFVSPTVINLYKDIVTFYSVSEDKIPFILLVENKVMSKSFREYFEWLWKTSSSK